MWHLSLCSGISAPLGHLSPRSFSPPTGISASAWASQPLFRLLLASQPLLGHLSPSLSSLLCCWACEHLSSLPPVMLGCCSWKQTSFKPSVPHNVLFFFFFFCCCCIIFISAMGICLLPCLPPFSRLFSPSPCSVEGSGGSRGPGLTMFDLTSTLPKRLGLNYAISLPPGLYTCCTSMSSLVLCLWFCTRGPSRCTWKPCVPT